MGTQTIIEHLDDSDPLKIALEQDDYFRDDTEQHVKDIDEYIGKVFVEDADDKKLYLFTYTVTWCLLNLSHPETGRKIDGIMYPSVANNLEGFNLALTTKFVDDNIILENALMYKIVSSEKPTYKLDLVNVLDPLVEGDTILNWREINTGEIFIVSDEKDYPTINILPYDDVA